MLISKRPQTQIIYLILGTLLTVDTCTSCNDKMVAVKLLTISKVFNCEEHCGSSVCSETHACNKQLFQMPLKLIWGSRCSPLRIYGGERPSYTSATIHPCIKSSLQELPTGGEDDGGSAFNLSPAEGLTTLSSVLVWGGRGRMHTRTSITGDSCIHVFWKSIQRQNDAMMRR